MLWHARPLVGGLALLPAGRGLAAARRDARRRARRHERRRARRRGRARRPPLPRRGRHHHPGARRLSGWPLVARGRRAALRGRRSPRAALSLGRGEPGARRFEQRAVRPRLRGLPAGRERGPRQRSREQPCSAGAHRRGGSAPRHRRAIACGSRRADDPPRGRRRPRPVLRHDRRHLRGGARAFSSSDSRPRARPRWRRAGRWARASRRSPTRSRFSRERVSAAGPRPPDDPDRARFLRRAGRPRRSSGTPCATGLPGSCRRSTPRR